MNQAHVELTVINVDVWTLQYGLFPGENKHSLSFVLAVCETLTTAITTYTVTQHVPQ